MKKLILSLVLCCALITEISASGDPIEALKVISNSRVKVTLSNVSQIGMFEDAVFLPQSNVLKFQTKDNISYIQVFDNDGALQYQLPVHSKKVRISKSLFTKGTYRLGFMIDDKKEILFINLTVN